MVYALNYESWVTSSIPRSFLFFFFVCFLFLFYPITLEGRRGTTDEFTTIPFHPDLFSAALVELAKSIPVHSLILSSRLFLFVLINIKLKSRLRLLDGWITCDFTSFSTVFQSYQDDGRLIMNGCVQWNSIHGVTLNQH